MRGWWALLGGMLVWTIHFFALWIIGSVFFTTPLAKWLTGVATLLCLTANAALLAVLLRQATRDGFERWVRAVSMGGIALSMIAVIWQGLPALLIR